MGLGKEVSAVLGDCVEEAVTFECQGDWLYGVMHLGIVDAKRGVVLVVGGPQYRVGSHRQFLFLARMLAKAGIPVLRFDYRGMGDSEGKSRTFETVELDIRAASDYLLKCVPSVEEVILWGLCDAASAALFYAHKDPRVTGLVLLNPWVRTEEGIARAYVKHYYFSRLISAGLWRKVLRGEFGFRESFLSFYGNLRQGLLARLFSGIRKSDRTGTKISSENKMPLPERMEDGLRDFNGEVLLILSGKDLTADEFRDLVKSSRRWMRLLRAKRVTTKELKEADHTFSSRKYREQVECLTLEWLKSW